jgi:PAP2 superfamily
MGEVPGDVALRSQQASSAGAFATVLVLAGRVLALGSAFFLIYLAMATGPTLFGAMQPLAIATVLLFAVFAKRSNSSLLAMGYVLGFMMFLYLRTTADETSIPVHFGYPIFLEHILFLGTLPSVWLQEALYVPGRVGALDVILSSVYITYFVAPHLIAIVVWRTRPQLFPKVIVALSLTFLIGLLCYFTIPTAPPWLAAQNGNIDADIHRVVPEVSALIAGDTYDQTSAAVGKNDIAAMPSLHTALTAMVALILASYGRRWRWVGVAYVCAMALALVYLGEHYVIDELAGIALAIGIWKMVSTSRAFAWLSSREETSELDATSAKAASERAA